MRQHWLSRWPRPLLLLAALLAGTFWLAPGQAQAGRARVYYFLLSDVQLAEGVPGGVEALVRERLTKAIAAHERLVGALPAGAPDPEEAPKAFRAYVKRRRIAPYRVSVEVTRYRQEVEPAPRGAGQRLVVSIDLHVFGETMPQRVMAFSGDGSATVKLDIGKRVRARDEEVAHEAVLEQAVAEALGTSLRRLEEKSRKGRKARRVKKK